MKRIWWLWFCVGYVLAHVIAIPFAVYLHQWWFVAIGTAAAIYVAWAIWPRRHYLFNRNEY